MLAQNVQWKVRRTLAASIHEIANILGEQMASEELVDIFNDFLNVSFSRLFYFWLNRTLNEFSRQFHTKIFVSRSKKDLKSHHYLT